MQQLSNSQRLVQSWGLITSLTIWRLLATSLVHLVLSCADVTDQDQKVLDVDIYKTTAAFAMMCVLVENR